MNRNKLDVVFDDEAVIVQFLSISLMTVIWKCQVSSAVGMINSGGNRNPYRPGIEQSVITSLVHS